jgi:hypothetical protein
VATDRFFWSGVFVKTTVIVALSFDKAIIVVQIAGVTIFAESFAFHPEKMEPSVAVAISWIATPVSIHAVSMPFLPAMVKVPLPVPSVFTVSLD